MNNSNFLIEMLAHVPLSTHKEPKNIFLVSDQPEEYIFQFSKYKFLNLDVEVSSIDDFNNRIVEFNNETFDVAIIEKNISNIDSAHISRILKRDGLVSAIGDSNFISLKELAKNFRIAMPYIANNNILLFGSKFYHSTADINLQRSDLLEDLNYYNSDIHISSFSLPNYIKREISSFVKN